MPTSSKNSERVSRDRARMLALVAREVQHERVIEALAAVPREEFVPHELEHEAYLDAALPIGAGQTISQPLIVGLMTEAAALCGDEKVLEIGTGSGYQAAILARLAREIVTVERVDELRRSAEERLARLGVRNVRCIAAGEVLGSPADGPFDVIVVTAAAPTVPQVLIEQLVDGGRMVIPVGSRERQELLVVRRRGDQVELQQLGGCRFVPLIGAGGFSAEGYRNS